MMPFLSLLRKMAYNRDHGPHRRRPSPQRDQPNSAIVSSKLRDSMANMRPISINGLCPIPDDSRNHSEYPDAIGQAGISPQSSPKIHRRDAQNQGLNGGTFSFTIVSHATGHAPSAPGFIPKLQLELEEAPPAELRPRRSYDHLSLLDEVCNISTDVSVHPNTAQSAIRAKISELKSKIVKFDRDFEAKNGRKPEKQDKIPIRSELKEYKRLKGTIRSPSCLSDQCVVAVYFITHTVEPRSDSGPISSEAQDSELRTVSLALPAKVDFMQTNSLSLSLDARSADPLSSSIPSSDALLPSNKEQALQWANEQLNKWRAKHNIPGSISVRLLMQCISSSHRHIQEMATEQVVREKTAVKKILSAFDKYDQCQCSTPCIDNIAETTKNKLVICQPRQTRRSFARSTSDTKSSRQR